MDPTVIGILGGVVLLVLMGLGVHVFVAMGVVGLLGIWAIAGPGAALGVLYSKPFVEASLYDYAVVPLFVLMGELAFAGGLTRSLFSSVYKWLGSLPGGLGLATMGACAAFAANTGSSIASCVTIGKVALPEMRRFGYDRKFATGTLAAGGCLGVLIPPSILAVIYAIVTGISCGKVLIAGVIPGVITAVLFMTLILARAARNPELGPRGGRSSWKERVVAVKDMWATVVIAVCIIGGIYSGIFTATEAGAIGAFVALLICLTTRGLTRLSFWNALLETAKTSVMIYAVLLGTSIFVCFMAISRIPVELSNAIIALPAPPIAILVAICILYFILGMFIHALGMMLLTLPVIFPAILALGFNPIWFGILVIKLSEIGQLTPPVGLNVYAINAVDPDTPLSDVFRGALPFVIAEFFAVAILVAWPEITLFLPNMMS